MIVIRENLDVHKIEISSDKEVCFINLKIERSTLKIGVVYRPPSANIVETNALT